MEPESTPVVPAQRLLEIAGVLSDGAARMHAELRHVDPARRDALLDLMTSQLGTLVQLWSELVRDVVSVEAPAPQAASSWDRSAQVPAPAAPVPAPAAPAPAPPAPISPAQAPPAQVPPAQVPPAQVPPAQVPPAQPPPAPAPPAQPPAPGVAARPRPPSDLRRERLASVPDPWAESRSATGMQLVSDPPAPGAPRRQAAPPAPASGSEVERATRDELTGVLNHTAGMAALQREIDRCRQGGWRFVLGYLNVDGLRHVNEASGPQAGDELLRKVAAALRATLRSYDVISRLGGDEFLFSLPGADVAAAEQRFRQFSVVLGEESPGASASVGFAELHEGDTLDDLVARADHALIAGRRPRRHTR